MNKYFIILILFGISNLSYTSEVSHFILQMLAAKRAQLEKHITNEEAFQTFCRNIATVVTPDGTLHPAYELEKGSIQYSIEPQESIQREKNSCSSRNFDPNITPIVAHAPLGQFTAFLLAIVKVVPTDQSTAQITYEYNVFLPNQTHHTVYEYRNMTNPLSIVSS